MTEQENIRRSARGKRPQYFEDPACDGLHFMVMSLLEELSATRDRLDALERVLEQQGITSVAAVDAFEPNAAALAERAQRRDDFVRRITKYFADQTAQLEGEEPALEIEDVINIMRD